MLRVFGDFETYYQDGVYTLRKQSPVEYILDARYQTLACAIAIEHDEPFLLKDDDVADYLRELKRPWCFISHNALFDACILSYRYGILPDANLCTLSMSRALLSHVLPKGSVSLENVSKYFDLPRKRVEFIKSMSGKKLNNLTPEQMIEFVSYTITDVSNCREIFFRLRAQLPPQEARMMDMTIRMATVPQLQVNSEELDIYLDDLIVARGTMLARVNGTRDLFMSNQKFADLLRAHGVEPPMKISLTTGYPTYAFAKTDSGMIELMNHEDPEVQAIVAARLGLKTTIEETRTKRFLDITDATEATYGNPWLPVPLKYSGAHTHRLSGDWKLNMQNLGARKTKRLRSCVVAPEGMTIVAVDASQIEARLTAWLAGQHDLVQMFADGVDVYQDFADDIKATRFTGKTCILGLGFGMSARRLLQTLIIAAEGREKYTIEQCEDWVRHYRTRFSAIKLYWYELQELIRSMANGQTGMRIGPCVTDGCSVILPSELRLYYEGLTYLENEQGRSEYWFKYKDKPERLYGGKLLENVVQALDRQHVMEAALRIEQETSYHMALQVHDENVFVVDDADVDSVARVCLKEMCRVPWWGEGLPLAAEVKVGKNYGELEKFNSES